MRNDGAEHDAADDDGPGRVPVEPEHGWPPLTSPCDLGQRSRFNLALTSQQACYAFRFQTATGQLDLPWHSPRDLCRRKSIAGADHRHRRPRLAGRAALQGDQMAGFGCLVAATVRFTVVGATCLRWDFAKENNRSAQSLLKQSSRHKRCALHGLIESHPTSSSPA
jgi:hypothetical protein